MKVWYRKTLYTMAHQLTGMSMISSTSLGHVMECNEQKRSQLHDSPKQLTQIITITGVKVAGRPNFFHEIDHFRQNYMNFSKHILYVCWFSALLPCRIFAKQLSMTQKLIMQEVYLFYHLTPIKQYILLSPKPKKFFLLDNCNISFGTHFPMQ